MADISDDNNLQLQSHHDEVVGHAGGTEANASECIPKRYGHHTPITHIAQISSEQGFCQEFYHCKEQNGFEFGCVSLSPLRLFTGDPTYWEKLPDIISALIRASGLPNFWALEFQFILSLMLNLGGFIGVIIGIRS